jgi:hypothetical protein
MNVISVRANITAACCGPREAKNEGLSDVLNDPDVDVGPNKMVL